MFRLLRSRVASMLLATCLLAWPAAGQMPPMPGMTNGPGGAPGMIHTEVFFDGTDLSVELVGGGTFAGDVDAPVQMSAGAGFAAPFDVLNGRGFNAQFGWLPSQQPGNLLQDPNALPLDRIVAVELTGLDGANPGPLYTFSGGNGVEMMNGQHTMAPLFEAVGEKFLWDDFVMHHNWYAVDTPGLYTATYDVYVSDPAGVRDTSYGGDSVTLRFNYVPEPATLVAAAPALLLSRRRGAAA